MGQFIARQEICIKEFFNPVVTEKRETLLITTGGPITITAKRVVILAIYLRCTKNDGLEPVQIQIHGLASRKPIVVVCPANYNGKVTDACDELLYKPMVAPHILRKFVGMEDAIAKAVDVVHESNPLISFVLDNREALDPVDMQKRENGYYFVQPEFLERVKRFFKNAIFDNYNYDTLSELEVEPFPSSSGVAFVLEIEYLHTDGTVEKSMKVMERFI